MTDLRVRQKRWPRSRGRTERLTWSWAGSAAAHLFILLALILLHAVAIPPQPEDEAPIAVEFEPDQSQTKGGPSPSNTRETPQGETAANMRPTPNTAPQPDTQPQINIVPPEYRQMEPPPPDADAEPLPPPMPAPRYKSAPVTRHAENGAFSHPMEFSYAPRDTQGRAAGLRNSRSIDLSAGPVIRGGHLLDSVAHVVGQGGVADYLALLREFVETHKYYPPEAARNGEEGSATVEVTVRRDGTTRNVKLVGSSGSELLDLAWLAVFRDNRLPPLTDDIPGVEFTFTFTLDYTLIYGPPPG